MGFFLTHHPSFCRAVMVISEQMQTPMDYESLQLFVHGHMITDCLIPGAIHGDVYLAQQILIRRGVVVHLKRQDIRCAIQMAIFTI